MQPKTLMPIGASLIAAVILSAPAQAQNWNYYSSYTSLPTIPFANGPQSASGGLGASVFMQMTGGSPTAFTMDTGSTGIVVSPDYFKPGPNDIKQGPGSVTYSSSGLTYKGDYYLTNVGILQTAKVGDGKGTPGTPGAQLATSQVTVLAVNQLCDSNGTNCRAPNPIAYMGVGYDRDQMSTVAPAGSNINAFTNINSLASGASLSTYRQGYVISNTGITLGLSSAATQNFGIIKLVPDPTKSFQTAGVPWSTAPMTVLVNDGKNANRGTLLPDTGIGYMFLNPGPNNGFAITKCSGGIDCASAGTKIQIWLPGQTGTAASFTYIAPDPTGTPAPAGRVEADGASNPAFINTGRQFYENFTYFYDDVGGFVGYTTTPNGTWAVTAFQPVLSLTGTVPLPNGFQEAMPIVLDGSTLLQTSGSAAFNGSITGNNNSLTLGGGGAYAFNAPVNLGSGSFNLQQGAASINAGLSAASVNVGAQTALNNSAGSTITANVANAGALNNNGVITGNVTNNGALAGGGTIAGNLINAGSISPGNSIGTMTVGGNYAHTGAGNFYVAEVNAAGQSDRINVGGTATIQGGPVTVVALQGGTYAPRTTYTLLSAAGGLSGTFASVTDPYPFFLPTLSYDANNVYLTLQIGGFAAAAANRNQAAVGRVLDANANTASGDFAQVLGSMAINTLSNSQAQATLTALSGQNYSTFSSTMVQGAYLFLNNFANITGGGGSPVSNRVALAEACDVACDVTPPAVWGAWGGALGGLGTIGSGATTGAVTYNVGGFAAGLDRLVAPGLRVGVTTGYTTGTQWTSGFTGTGMTDTFLAGLYGGYNMDKVYADAVLGYAYSYNQMWRQIFIPGLQQRTAQGRTGANQWYGQIEGGYRFDIGTPVGATVTPFMRWQGYTGYQNGFTESGAQSLNLAVAGQTTNSLRSVIGAQLGGALDLGWREKLALQFRLGWSHEYASVSRPVTATLAGAPLMAFTTYGIAPTRDGALVGFAANTAIADGTSMYLRYEGIISGSDSAHALTAGVRMSW